MPPEASGTLRGPPSGGALLPRAPMGEPGGSLAPRALEEGLVLGLGPQALHPARQVRLGLLEARAVRDHLRPVHRLAQVEVVLDLLLHGLQAAQPVEELA